MAVYTLEVVLLVPPVVLEPFQNATNGVLHFRSVFTI
jgi:hypothetical protein